MKSRSRIASILTAIALTTTLAQADWKVQSGVTCQARDPDSSKVFVDSSGIHAESTVTVYCPILRDTSSALAEVTVGFTRLTADTSCTLFAKDITGFNSDSVTVSANTGPFTHADATSMSFDLSGLSEGTEKTYVVRCNLNETSGFLSTLTGIYYEE